MSKLIEAEAEMLAALICSDPPMTPEKATNLLAAALGLAESRGNISGMQYANQAIDRAFQPGAAKVA